MTALPKIVQGLMRLFLGPVVNWLVERDIITADEGLQLVLELAGYAVAVGWMVWARVKEQRTADGLQRTIDALRARLAGRIGEPEPSSTSTLQLR